MLQASTSWQHEVYQFLSLDKSSGDEVPGSDAQNTKYVFAKQAQDKIEPIVERFGG